MPRSGPEDSDAVVLPRCRAVSVAALVVRVLAVLLLGLRLGLRLPALLLRVRLLGVLLLIGVRLLLRVLLRLLLVLLLTVVVVLLVLARVRGLALVLGPSLVAALIAVRVVFLDAAELGRGVVHRLLVHGLRLLLGGGSGCRAFFLDWERARRNSMMIGTTESRTIRSRIGSMFFLTKSMLPSQEPSRVTPAPHRMPPMTLKIRNERYRMPLTPAMIGVNVRTMGTKRARTRDLGPYFSKNSCALVTFSCLKRRESGRVKRDGPTFLPNM